MPMEIQLLSDLPIWDLIRLVTHAPRDTCYLNHRQLGEGTMTDWTVYWWASQHRSLVVEYMLMLQCNLTQVLTCTTVTWQILQQVHML